MIRIVITIMIETSKYFYIINLKKTMGIKTLYLTEAEIRIRLCFKSGNWGDQGNSTVILRRLCSAFQLTLLITIQCNFNWNFMTNFYDNQSHTYILFSLILRCKLKLRCLTRSWQFHQQMKYDCGRENEQIN